MQTLLFGLRDTWTTLTDTRVQLEETKGKWKGSSGASTSAKQTNKQEPRVILRDGSEELLRRTTANTPRPSIKEIKQVRSFLAIFFF